MGSERGLIFLSDLFSQEILRARLVIIMIWGDDKNLDALAGDTKKYSVTDNLKPRDASASKKEEKSQTI